jgi:hypothetical protein
MRGGCVRADGVPRGWERDVEMDMDMQVGVAGTSVVLCECSVVWRL